MQEWISDVLKISIIIMFLCVLSYFDMKYRAIPKSFLLVGSVIGVCCAGYCVLHQTSLIWQYLLACIPGAFFMLTAVLTQKVGLGDGWLLLILGVTLKYNYCLTVFTISMFLISGYSIVQLIIKRKKQQSTIPYVPFLTMAMILCLICKINIIK